MRQRLGLFSFGSLSKAIQLLEHERVGQVAHPNSPDAHLGGGNENTILRRQLARGALSEARFRSPAARIEDCLLCALMAFIIW